MSGWDTVRRVQLGAPWESFWVEVAENLPMGDLLDVQDSATALGTGVSRETLEPIVGLIGRLVTTHNITDRDGNPLTFSLRSMSASLIVACVAAIGEAQGGGGEIVPLVKPETSPTP